MTISLKNIFLVMLFSIIIIGVAIITQNNIKNNEENSSPESNPIFIINPSTGNGDNEVIQNIDLSNEEHVNAVLNDKNFEYEYINNELLNTVYGITPNPQGFDIKNEEGINKLYFRSLPLIVKKNEPIVWNNALNRVVKCSYFKKDYPNEVVFNIDPFEEFVAGVWQSVLNTNLTENDIVCIILIKWVILTKSQCTKYTYYTENTIAVYSIPIYKKELKQVINDKYVNNLLNQKLKYNNLN